MGTKKSPQRFATSPLRGVIIRETSCSSYFRRCQKLCSSFLTRTLCLRILSLCLSRDVHFSHDFQLQENQFLQLFRSFLSPRISPFFFPFRGHSSHYQSPRIPRSFPQVFALSGGNLRRRIPKQSLRGDFQSKHYTFCKNSILFSANFSLPWRESGGIFGG